MFVKRAAIAIAIWVYCCCASGQQAVPGSSMSQEKARVLVQTYSTGETGEKEAAKAEILRQSKTSSEFRTQVIVQLSSLLDNSDASISARAISADTLGELRAAEAIPVLLKHITLVRGGTSGLSLSVMPSADALAKIGQPAVPPLEHLLKDPDPSKRTAAARALSDINDPSALPALEAALKVEKDQQAKFFIDLAVRVVREK
jgi:HEAT repeat protein